MSVIIDTSVWSLYVRRKRRQVRPEQRSCLEEVRLLLREGGRNLLDTPEPELFARACDHGWTFACGRLTGSL